jgi:hypothetical protein
MRAPAGWRRRGASWSARWPRASSSAPRCWWAPCPAPCPACCPAAPLARRKRRAQLRRARCAVLVPDQIAALPSRQTTAVPACMRQHAERTGAWSHGRAQHWWALTYSWRRCRHAQRMPRRQHRVCCRTRHLAAGAGGVRGSAPGDRVRAGRGHGRGSAPGGDARAAPRARQVVANKADAAPAGAGADLAARLGVERLEGRAHRVQAASALSGSGVREGLQWLVEQARGRSPGSEGYVSGARPAEARLQPCLCLWWPPSCGGHLYHPASALLVLGSSDTCWGVYCG